MVASVTLPSEVTEAGAEVFSIGVPDLSFCQVDPIAFDLAALVADKYAEVPLLEIPWAVSAAPTSVPSNPAPS